MERMTLHEAQAKVAAVYERQGWTAPIDWERPVEAAVYFLHVRANGGDSARRAALEIGRVLLAYHAHLAFEAGRAFSDAAILAYADRDMGIPLYSFANDVREGFHLAETT